MSRLSDLPLRIKFFGLMSLLLLVLLVVTGIFTYQRQQSLIVQFAIDNARTFAKELVETREYMSSVVKDEPEHNYNLVPQVVATQVARLVTQNSKFYVRQVSLRYRNPQNSPDPYEKAQLEKFRHNPPREVYDIVDTGGSELFRYMQPMLATASCLNCHGPFETAPDFVKERFPPGHYSYNYHIGEVIGAVSVTIPLKDLYAQLGVNFALDMAARTAIFLIVVTVMALIMSREIVAPVRMLSETITRVTRTGDFSEKLPRRSNDEIGKLIGAFNEMMDELSRRTVQSHESEERYRKFIEVAASAIVTFLKDGRIVIANHKAETLLGRSRQDLLGDNIFDYLEGGPALKEKLAGGQIPAEATSIQRVIKLGRAIEVEMVLTASQTDRDPMFTAIFREHAEV
ncbi:DUF3365 domain-containing protein [Geomonas sp. Red32]|uniref:c-type heme family protein n=1 Tax=Geomonas sp. Red32 TaxID=2912856 RepID=UPI00202CF6D8|nr:DUF3365 domain-containing protein [Geomonas sp. Red32]MCM0080647.1 DUF3365 domain-containing protein [Geomonas sp. Red32]